MMMKFEYYCIDGDSSDPAWTTAAFDKLGSEGWEMTGVVDNHFWFKRPIEEVKSAMRDPENIPLENRAGNVGTSDNADATKQSLPVTSGQVQRNALALAMGRAALAAATAHSMKGTKPVSTQLSDFVVFFEDYYSQDSFED